MRLLTGVALRLAEWLEGKCRALARQLLLQLHAQVRIHLPRRRAAC